MWDLIQKYLTAKQEFELRFAIVMILDFYIEEDYIERNFKIFDSVSSDAYYVQMAIAWAISICLIKFYDESVQYLKTTTALDDFTYNKAIQKARESYRITDRQKEYLKKMKRV